MNCSFWNSTRGSLQSDKLNRHSTIFIAEVVAIKALECMVNNNIHIEAILTDSQSVLKAFKANKDIAKKSSLV